MRLATGVTCRVVGPIFAVLLVAAPVHAAIRTATNGSLTVKLNDDTAPSGGAGLFTVETGAFHPQPGKSIFFNSASNNIDTSFITVIDFDAKIIWVNALEGRANDMTPVEAGYTVQRMVTQPTTIQNLGTSGFRTTYTLPKFTVVQEVLIMGSTLFNSSVMHHVMVTNTSGADIHYGVRYLWDWMVAAIDASWFKELDPDGSFSNSFVAIDDPAFSRYEASDSATFPSFEIFGTVQGGALWVEPRRPDQLRYASWGDAAEYPWDFTVAGGGSDSAIVYYWGLAAPLVLAPGSSTTFTQYVTANAYGLRRGLPRISLGLSTTGYVCAGDAVTYTLSFTNIGDGTIHDLVLTETVPAAVDYLPGSLEFWAGSGGGTPPVLSSSAWASSLDGPWTQGEPPASFLPPHILRWTVDRIGPGQSGYIRFTGNLARGAPPGLTLISQASATMGWDSGLFRSGDASNETLAAVIYKNAEPAMVDMGNTLRYTMVALCPCATTIYNVSVFDTVPTGMDLLEPFSTDGVLSGTRFISWTLGDLEPGESEYIYFDAVANGAKDLVRNYGVLDYSSLRNGTMEAQPDLVAIADVDVNLPVTVFRKYLWPPGQIPAPPDGQVTFAIEVLNQRNVTLYNVTMWDTLPPGMSYISDTFGGTVVGDTIFWNLADIHPGDNPVVSLTVQLSGSCYTLGPNTAWLNFDSVADPRVPTPPTSSGDAYVQLAVPKLVMSRVPNPVRVPPGDLLTYAITVGNTGGAKAYDIWIYDSLPANATFVDMSPGGTHIPGTPGMVTWALSPIPASGTHWVWYTVIVDTGPACVQSLTSAVKYNSGTSCSTFTSPIWDMCVFKAQPKIEMWKYVDQPLVPVGGVATWTITLTNTGDDTALDVVIWDEIMSGLSFTGCDAPPGWTCSQSGSQVIWSVPGISAGRTTALSFTTQVVGPALPPCVIMDGNNYAEASYLNRVGQQRGVATSTAACLKLGDAEVLVEKIPNYNPVTQDTNLTWWFTLSNTGVLAASNVVLWDTLPPGGDYVGCGGDGTCSQSGGLVVWQVPDIPAGARAQVYVTVTARPGMSCTNTGEASFTNPLGFARPRALAVGPCVPVVLPVMEVSKRPLKAQYVNGEPVTFVLSYTNVGTGVANKVRLTDYVGTNMEFLGATVSSSGDPWSTGLVGSTVEVIWDLGSVLPGQAGSATVSLRPLLLSATACESGDFTNRALIKYEKETGVWLSDDTGQVPAFVADTVVSLVLAVAPPVVDVGKQATYTLTIRNECEGTVANLTVWDSLPAGTGFVSANTGGTHSAGVVSWLLPPVMPYESVQVAFTVTVTGTGPWIGPDLAEADFTNGVAYHQPRAMSNTVWLGVQNPVLTMTKTASPVPVPAGSVLGYRIELANTGAITAVAVAAWDTLPAGAAFVSCQGGSSCWHDGTRVNWVVPDIPPGGSVALTVSVTATSGMACPNIARAEYAVSGGSWRIGLPSNAVCAAVVESAMTLGMTVDRPIHASGEAVAYAILCVNTGSDTAISIVISDSWPAGVSFWSATPGGGPAPGGWQWTIPPLSPGASATVFVSLRAPVQACEAFAFQHRAFARFANSAGMVQPAPVPVALSVTVTGVALSLGLAPAATVVQQGGAVVFTLSWSNPCSDTAWGVVLWDTVPVGSVFVSSDPPGVLSGAVLSWIPGDVPPGRTGSARFALSVTGDGPYVDVAAAAAAFSTSAGTSGAGLSGPAVITVVRPAVTIEKRGPSAAVRDGMVEYVITVRNAGGTDTAFDISVVDTMPPPLVFRGSVPPAVVNGSVLSWSITRLGIGETATITVRAEGPPGEVDAEPVNCASVTWRTPLGVFRASTPSCVTVVLSPVLVVRIYPNPFDPGKAVRGTMKFTGLPFGSFVTLYTLTGVRMRMIDDPSRHTLEWDGRNDDGSPVAAGVYLYVVDMPDGKGGRNRLKGKFGVVR